MPEVLKAPYPWMGGKARVADYVWSRLGNVSNYCEPFMGSLAVLLRRPADHFGNGYRVETCNDLNQYIVNVWRAVQRDPDAVAAHADNPVFEADLHARHQWLVRSSEVAAWRKRFATDPDYYDAKIAGFWVWGACAWIGSGWCAEGVDWQQTQRRDSVGQDADGIPPLTAKRTALGNRRGDTSAVASPTGRPQLTDQFDIGRGVNANGALSAQVPRISELGVGVNANAEGAELSSQVPLLSGGGDGVYSVPAAQIRDLSGGFGGGGMGVNGSKNVGAESLQIPLLSHTPLPGVCADATHGTCDARRAWLIDWMRRLSDRLRLVRTCYGHWSRICDSDSTLTRLGTTGVFLDPPYPVRRSDDGTASRADNLYSTDKGSDLNELRDEVLAWCVKWGGDAEIRVALCAYEGDGYEPLSALGWTVHEWEANGGYGNQGRKGNGKAANAKRERIYFSPACVPVARAPSLFDDCDD